MKNVKKLNLSVQIFLALVLGVLVGFLFRGNPEIATKYIKPFGTIFLNLIKTIVVPVVLFSIIRGITSLQDIKQVGKIGGKTIVYYLATTAFAVSIGLFFANVLNVGGNFVLSAEELTYEAQVAPGFVDTLVNIFPNNAVAPLVNANMLQIIVLAFMIGFGIIYAKEKGQKASEMVDSFYDVFIEVMTLIIKFSPIGVFALMVPVVAVNGADVLLPLLRLIGIVYLACAVHAILVYSTSVKLFAHISPIQFFKKMAPAMLFAYSSANSVGTLPLNMKCVESLGAKKEAASFILPLGATINMDGTAIYQGVCAIFIAQIFGVDLTLVQMMTIVLTATVASIGTAGVPGAGVFMLPMVLTSVGLPIEGIAIVAGVDRILDMARTVVNITGDAACTLCIGGVRDMSKDTPAEE